MGKDSRERGTIKEKESKVATKENIKQKIDSENTQEGTKEIDNIQGSGSTKPEVSKQGIQKKTEIYETEIYEGAKGLSNLLESKDTTVHVPQSNNQESICLHDSTSTVGNERQPTDVCHSNKDGV